MLTKLPSMDGTSNTTSPTASTSSSSSSSGLGVGAIAGIALGVTLFLYAAVFVLSRRFMPSTTASTRPANVAAAPTAAAAAAIMELEAHVADSATSGSDYSA
jgi:hypothetical protein